MAIRKDLWSNDKGKYKPCLFIMTNTMMNGFFNVLKNIKMLYGYSRNIVKCINLKQHKLFRLKSHDCHVLMQQSLPLAICNVLLDKVTVMLVELSSCFRQIRNKAFNLVDLENF